LGSLSHQLIDDETHAGLHWAYRGQSAWTSTPTEQAGSTAFNLPLAKGSRTSEIGICNERQGIRPLSAARASLLQ
jgi:hypothetical protein